MATPAATIILDPHLNNLPRLMQWVELEVARLSSTMAVNLKVQLVLEELFLNSINHSGAKDKVVVSIVANVRGLLVSYEDSGEPYDPEKISTDAESMTRNSLEDRLIGGLGLLLVYQLPSDTAYSHIDGHNQFALTFGFDDNKQRT